MTRDLFGEETPATARPTGTVALRLTLFRETPAAWLLGPGVDQRAAKWAPKSEVRRGEGRDEGLWLMPAWVAADRGWS